jgi:hypothetical protein
MKKKTIALLFVMAIAMFGAFAENTTLNDTLHIGTLIDAVNRMGIYGVGAPAPDVNTNAWNSSYTATTVSTASETAVAVLHTRSNNRGGYNVEMTATPLYSEDSTYATAYLSYTANAYEGSTLTGTVSYEASTGAVEGSTDTIIESGLLTAITTNSRDISVTIPDYATALQGEYFATIVFTYSAL